MRISNNSDAKEIDYNLLDSMLEKHKFKMNLSLKVCARCSLCAESCFLFHTNSGEPAYMPSFKVINSVGKLYKKKKKITFSELESMKEDVWNNCALCTRCYCPFGIDIPDMIAFARSVLRNQGISPDFSN